VNTDVRDDELGKLLDGAVVRVHADPEGRLESVRRSGNRRRTLRWISISSALALFLGALGWTAVELRSRGNAVLLGGRGGPVSLEGSGWARYHQPDQNWTLRYPPQWYLQPFTISCPPHFGSEGAIVTNVAHVFKQVKGANFCTGSWDMRGLPSTLVVVELARSGGGPVLPPGCCGQTTPPDTPLPLSLDSAERANDVSGEEPGEPWGAPQPRLYLTVTIQGNDYSLNVWIGHDASALDREIASRIVSSIEFGRQTNPFSDFGPSPSP
jgi:hypothetical protein